MDASRPTVLRPLVTITRSSISADSRLSLSLVSLSRQYLGSDDCLPAVISANYLSAASVRPLSGSLSGPCLGHISAVSRLAGIRSPLFGRCSTISLSRVSAISRPSLGRVSTFSQPTLSHLTVVCSAHLVAVLRPHSWPRLGCFSIVSRLTLSRV